MWWKRCLVIAPALLLVIASLVASCGGGSSSPAVIPTLTPVLLKSIRICVPTAPTASPTSTVVPGATPTPIGLICVKAPPTEVTAGEQLQFTAQGQFTTNGVPSILGLTNAASWFTTSSYFISLGNGLFVAGSPATPACACISASSGGISSQSIQIGIGQSPASCAPCP